MADETPDSLEEPIRQVTRGAIRGALEGIKGWFLGLVREQTESAKPSRRLLILGPGGTGKTTLARLLSNQIDWLDEEPGRYSESIDLEYFNLSDDPDVEAVVAPGQEHRREATWPELLQQVAKGEYRGVILVNAFGYHALRTPSYKNHQLFKGSKPTFLENYYRHRRADEIRVLDQLVPHLSVCAKKVWLLSVVAKQDLWGSQQADAEAHYLRGEYELRIAAISQKLGSRMFRHESAFVSLILRNLETTARELLQATEAGYDMRRQAESLNGLIRVIIALRAWEDET